MSTAVLVLVAFLASAVEMVEALTIVLAVGVTRGWRSTMLGVAGATAALAVVVAALGPALVYVPISTLRVVVGALLLVFGLQWLRKAVLRAAGVLALHDEAGIYEREVREARTESLDDRAIDAYAATLAFKGVFLEGLEVAFIVVTVGGAHRDVLGAAVGALAALVVVAAVGIRLHRPLTRVPENAMKFVVGVMLTGFGVFWSTEGLGGHWPGGDLALVPVVGVVALGALALVAALRARTSETLGSEAVP